MLEKICTNPAETADLAAAVASGLKPGMTVCLNGDLGAGKTFFVASLARTLGAAESASSPTFSLLNIYRGRIKLYHFDLYRLSNIDEMDDFGFYEYVEDEEAVSLIEWAEKFPAALPEDFIEINITRLANGGMDDTAARRFSFKAGGEGEKWLKEWEKACWS